MRDRSDSQEFAATGAERLLAHRLRVPFLPLLSVARHDLPPPGQGAATGEVVIKNPYGAQAEACQSPPHRCNIL